MGQSGLIGATSVNGEEMSAPPDETNFDLRTAASLRRMGVLGTLVALFIVASSLLAPPLAALLVFVWAWLSRTSLGEIGLKRPGSWLSVLIVGALGGTALYLAMKGVILPSLGAPVRSVAYKHLVGDFNAFLIEVPQMIILAGLAEEIVFRGFLINRLQALVGTSTASAVVIVIATAAIFGPLHYFTYGWFGAVQATIVGVLFAAIYLLNGQRLWSLIVAHATFDVVAIWVIYADLQEKVADIAGY